MAFPHFTFSSICRKLFGWYVRVRAPGRAGGARGAQEGRGRTAGAGTALGSVCRGPCRPQTPRPCARLCRACSDLSGMLNAED